MSKHRPRKLQSVGHAKGRQAPSRSNVVSNVVYFERSDRNMCNKRPYGFWRFVGDCFMTMITCGFWLIWIFIREMRNR